MATKNSTSKLLQDDFRGEVLNPASPDYDQARQLWNGMIDRRPALIARARDVNDVIQAVNFAQSQGMRVSVRGGGHGVAGTALLDDGLVIDLSGMHEVEVNVDQRSANVGPGATLEQMDAATQAHGLATTGGVDSRTGVAGLTLGGGMGWLGRSFGLSIDNLLSLDVVTADGELRRASEDENPDLFWALRGGGAGLGVVTNFEFRLHPVGPEVATIQVFHPLERGGEALRFFRDFMADAPDAVGCNAFAMPVPPVEPFPEDQHGKIAIAFVGCHSGPKEIGLGTLQSLADHGEPMLQMVQAVSYCDMQKSFNEATPDGARYYWKSQYLQDLSDAAIDSLIAALDTPFPGPFSAVAIESLGGAIGRVKPEATAFPHRSAPFNFGIWAGWEHAADDEQAIAWTRGIYEAMLPHSTGGVYANYLDRDDQDRMQAAFGANRERLEKIRKDHDPLRLFA